MAAAQAAQILLWKVAALCPKLGTTLDRQEYGGLKFYILDCDCIYYQKIFRDRNLDSQIGIYRDAENGPCEICMLQEENWEDRVIDGNVVYNSRFQKENI
jgi:hypothetical protein